MKKHLLLLTGLALSFFSIQSASAQNYQPFSRNHTYHFSAQDSIYALKIDSSYVQNGDSVFVFNKIAKEANGPVSPVPPGCTMFGGMIHYAIYGNNQFGQKMTKSANGDYVFGTIQGDQYLLKTKAAIGQSWPFRVGQSLTASLTSKTIEPVLTTTDSVLTYTLSNGAVIKLTKNHGFLKAPNFVSYSDPYFPTKTLDFYALPEKQLGNSVNDPFYIFDHQPGDVFGYYLQEVLYNSPLCWERWIRDEILSRTMNATGDTIFYRIQREMLERGHGHPSAPSSFCNRPQGFTLHPTTVRTVAIAKTHPLSTGFLTQHYYLSTTSQAQVITTIHKDAAYNNWERINMVGQFFTPCSGTFYMYLDNGNGGSYVAGLGKVRSTEQFYDGGRTEILQGYRKNGVDYGILRTMAQIMSVDKEKEPAPAISIFPNPAENAATLKFDQPLASGKLTVTVLNTMGQMMLQQEFSEVPEQQINLNLDKLAKGMYVVQATQNGKTFTSRFVKQ